MFASFLLALREGLEAALIVGIVLGALRKIHRSNLSSSVWQGVFAAVGVSALAGLALTWMGAAFEGRAEEIFEGITMLAAALLLTWMIVWMQRQSAHLQKELESGVARASAGQGNRWALFWLSFLAVGREGLELVLFLAAARMATSAFQTYLGALLGLAVAFALGWAFFASSKRMSLRLFFNVTSVLLVLFAAGLLAHGVHELNEARVIPPVIEEVWNINPILDEKHPVGQLLTALFGYNGNPSLTELLAYGVYFISAWAYWRKAPLAPALKPTG
jgi:high-affinity iron transporter